MNYIYHISFIHHSLKWIWNLWLQRQCAKKMNDIEISSTDELEKMRPAYHCDFRKTFHPAQVRSWQIFYFEDLRHNLSWEVHLAWDVVQSISGWSKRNSRMICQKDYGNDMLQTKITKKSLQVQCWPVGV